MPAFNFPIGSVLKTANYVTIPGQVAVITHKMQMVSISGASNFSSTAFLGDFTNNLATVLKPLISNDATYYGTQVYLMNPIGPAPRPDSDKLNAGVGTGGAGLLPGQSCGLIGWYTSLLGKQGQGRTYIPFPSPTKNDTNGTPVAGYVSLLEDYSSMLSNPMTIVSGGVTGIFEMVLYQGGAAATLIIDDGVARDAWATQRRRGAFGRTNSINF